MGCPVQWCHPVIFHSLFYLKKINLVVYNAYNEKLCICKFLAYRTAYSSLLAYYCPLSVHPSVTLCIVAKRYILQQMPQ